MIVNPNITKRPTGYTQPPILGRTPDPNATTPTVNMNMTSKGVWEATPDQQPYGGWYPGKYLSMLPGGIQKTGQLWNALTGAQGPTMGTGDPGGTESPEKYNDWYLGKNVQDWTGKIIKGASDTVKTVWDATRYMPYEGDVNDWSGAVRNVDTYNYKTQSDVLPKDWGQSGVGGAYQNQEDDALANFKRLGDSGITDSLGNDVVNLQNKLRGNQTAIDRAINQQDYQAITGNLTSPQSQWYQAQKALLDTNTDEARNKMLEGLGTSKGIGGGRQDMAMRKFANDQTAQQNAYLATAQKDSEAAARANQIALKGLENDLLKSSIDVAKTGNQSQLEANKATSDYVMNAAQQNTQRMAQNLQQSLANLDNTYKQKQLQLEQAGQVGDIAKWQNEYDVARQKLLTDQLSQLFGIGQNAIAGTAEAAGGVLKTILSALA